MVEAENPGQTRLVQIDGDCRLHWTCDRPECGQTSRLAGPFCRGCGARRIGEPEGASHHFGLSDKVGFAEQNANTQGGISLGSRQENILRLEILDDVLLVRSDIEDRLIPFCDYNAISRSPSVLSTGNSEEEDSGEIVRRRWQPVLRLQDKFYFSSGRTIHVLKRRHLARLVSDPSTVGLTRAIPCPGRVVTFLATSPVSDETPPLLVLHDDDGALALSEFKSSSWRNLATERFSSRDLTWVGFSSRSANSVYGLALGLEIDPVKPLIGQLSNAVSFSMSPSETSLEPLEIADSFRNAELLLDRPSFFRNGHLFLSAKAGSSYSAPLIVHITYGKVLRADHPKDQANMTIPFGADLGFVEMGPHEAFGIGSKNCLVWAGKRMQPGGHWRPPTHWDTKSASFSFDGAIAAGVVGTKNGTYAVAADIGEGLLECSVRCQHLSSTHSEILASALRYDVLWCLSNEHGEQRLRWFFLPTFRELYGHEHQKV